MFQSKARGMSKDPWSVTVHELVLYLRIDTDETQITAASPLIKVTSHRAVKAYNILVLISFVLAFS